MSYYEPIYDLRVPESKKDKKWYVDYLNYIIPYDSTVVDDYERLKLWYDVVNDNIDGFKEKLKAFCDYNIPSEVSAQLNFDREFEHYGRIFSKFEYLVGEMKRRSDRKHAALLTYEAIEAKNQELVQAISQAVEEELLLTFERAKLKAQGASETEVDSYIKSMSPDQSPEELASEDFRSSLEIFANQVLEYARTACDIDSKKVFTFKHAITADLPIIYVGQEHGKPNFIPINPLHFGYHKSPDEYKIEKGDYAWSKRSMTMSQIINLYGHELTDEDIKKIGMYTYSTSLAVNDRHNVIGNTKNDAKITYDSTSFELGLKSTDQSDKRVGQSMGSGVNRRYNSERLTWVTHFEFKAFREVYFISYKDELGSLVTDVYPKSFELPDEYTEFETINKFGHKTKKYEWVEDDIQYEAECLWIPRRYEITRIGNDVYLGFREVPNQPLNVDDPYGSFELSYKGRKLTAVNSESISLVGRALPYQFQYDLIKNLQNRELKKYRGTLRNTDIDQIPDYLTLDESGEPIPGLDKVAVYEYLIQELGAAYYSGSQDSMGLPNPNRTLPNRNEQSGVMAEIINMQQLLQLIDREIGMAMAVPLQAEGQIAPNSNASDNQQALQQSYTMLEYYLDEHSELWRSAMQEYLAQFRNYYLQVFEENPDLEETYLTYITPNNTKAILKIMPEHLSLGDMGVYITNANQDQQYRDIMLSQIQPIVQNRAQGVEAVSLILKMLTSGKSPETVHKEILKLKKQQESDMRKMEEMQTQRLQKLQEMRQQAQLEEREDNQRHEIEKTVLEESFSKDADEIPAALEEAKALLDMEEKRTDIALKRKQITENSNKPQS